MADTYDGSDRYQLEAIHIAAGDRKQPLLDLLERNGTLTDKQFPLLQVLAPDRAASLLLARLHDKRTDETRLLELCNAASQLTTVQAAWGLLHLAEQTDQSTTIRSTALKKVLANAGSQGNWSSLCDEPRFLQLLRVFLADESLRGETLHAINQLRLHPLGPDVLAIAQDETVDPAQRNAAIGVAGLLRPEAASSTFRQLLSNPTTAQAALRGLIQIQDSRTLRELLTTEKETKAIQNDTVDLLIESTPGAILLLRMIDENLLEESLRQRAIAKAMNHPDANLRVLYEKFVPEDQRPKKLGAEVSADEILALTGDVERGRNIFFRSSAAQCSQCHAVSGFGGTLGPELSNIGKKFERKALLETILEPSKAIAPEYVPYLVETTSGHVYVGFLIEKSDSQVILRDVKNQSVRIPTSEIEALVEQKKSLMPELILSEITSQDAADLLVFLESLK